MSTSRPTGFARFPVLSTALAALLTSLVQGCAVSSHPLVSSSAGLPSRSRDLLAIVDQPGPLTVETVVSANWAVPREGLLNLDHAKAKAAGLKEGDEPIEVDFHVVKHPRKGTFLVDTGFERRLRDDPEHAAMRGLVASYMHPEKLRFRAPLGEWLAAHPAPLSGVFLTHAHLDHVGGMPDVPSAVPVYTGPGELGARALVNFFVQGSTDRAFEGHGPVGEWRFQADPDGTFDGVVDVFGDRSMYAIWVPGHTAGSTAYLARTPTGPVLMVGDACHTAWGWEHGVEPGEFSTDRPKSAESLGRLRKLAAEHPSMDVRLGHQHRARGVVAEAARR